MSKPIPANAPCPEPFTYDDYCKVTAATRWSVWIEDFNDYLMACGIVDKMQILAMFKRVVGPEVRGVYRQLKLAESGYDAVVEKLSGFFKPMKSINFHVFKFCHMKQNETEALDDFVVRLREAAKWCEFKDDEDKEVLRQVMNGCKSQAVRELLFANDGLKLEDLLDKVRTNEAVTSYRKDTESMSIKTEKVFAIGLKTKCDKCGYLTHKNDTCPAANRKCNKCKKIGHFESCCTATSQIGMITRVERSDQEEKPVESHTTDDRLYGRYWF